MELNADFSQRVAVLNAENPWRASPSSGVDRKMLDRLGDEVARATTIVRFAPESAFARHTHTGGEEFIVLDGVFQDEHGDFPAGTYVRNPPTSAHTPGSKPGCTIFVKLWQFDPDDRHHVVIDMNASAGHPDPARAGVRVLPLFEDARETVTRETWDAGISHTLTATGGLELLVLSGSITEGDQTFSARDWLRVPDGADARLTAGPEGAEFWIKTDHLPFAVAPGA